MTPGPDAFVLVRHLPVAGLAAYLAVVLGWAKSPGRDALVASIERALEGARG